MEGDLGPSLKRALVVAAGMALAIVAGMARSLAKLNRERQAALALEQRGQWSEAEAAQDSSD
jgi:hypothetical protein